MTEEVGYRIFIRGASQLCIRITFSNLKVWVKDLKSKRETSLLYMPKSHYKHIFLLSVQIIFIRNSVRAQTSLRVTLSTKNKQETHVHEFYNPEFFFSTMFEYMRPLVSVLVPVGMQSFGKMISSQVKFGKDIMQS